MRRQLRRGPAALAAAAGAASALAPAAVASLATTLAATTAEPSTLASDAAAGSARSAHLAAHLASAAVRAVARAAPGTARMLSLRRPSIKRHAKQRLRVLGLLLPRQCVHQSLVHRGRLLPALLLLDWARPRR